MPNSSMSNTPQAGPGRGEGSPPPDADTIKADAGALMDEAQEVAGKIASEAGDDVSELAGKAQAKVEEAAEKFKGMAAEQKDLFAGQVGGVAEALERVAGDLEANNEAGAHYARMLADKAEMLSGTIRNNDLDQILGMAQDFGRRQPAAFLAGAALLGFAASRFLTATAKRPSEATDPSYVPPDSTGRPTGDMHESGRL